MFKCFQCGKELKPEQIKKRVRCLYCGSRIVFKARTNVTRVKAR